MPEWKRQDSYDYSRPQWEITPDPEIDNFTKLSEDIISSKTSYFVQGRGGTGKTTLINLIKKNLTENLLIKKRKKYRVEGQKRQTRKRVNLGGQAKERGRWEWPWECTYSATDLPGPGIQHGILTVTPFQSVSVSSTISKDKDAGHYHQCKDLY